MKKTGIVIMLIALSVLACRKDKTCVGKDKFGNQLFISEGSDQCEKNIKTANGEWCDCGNNSKPPTKTDSSKVN
jgi:hypothetical protein